MGILFQWIGTLLANIAGMFGISLAKKATLATAAIAASIALFAALAAFINALLVNIVYALPAWAQHAFILIPVNLPAVVSAVMSAKFARAVYDWNLTNLKIISTIN